MKTMKNIYVLYILFMRRWSIVRYENEYDFIFFNLFI